MQDATRRTLFSSAKGDHHTPGDIAERARYVLGGIELDPASDMIANQTIRAERYFAEPWPIDGDFVQQADPAFAGYDGLAHSWHARSLWLNPPFSVDKRDASGNVLISDRTKKPIRERVIDRWVARWLGARREVGAAMLLVPARVDTQWFCPLFGLTMCFVGGRLKFSDADNSAPFPTVLVYYGPLVDRFHLVFEEIGVCGRFLQDFNQILT